MKCDACGFEHRVFPPCGCGHAKTAHRDGFRECLIVVDVPPAGASTKCGCTVYAAVEAPK